MKFFCKAFLLFAASLLVFSPPATAQVTSDEIVENQGTLDVQGKYTLLNNKFGNPGAGQSVWRWQYNDIWGWGSWFNKSDANTVNAPSIINGWHWSTPKPGSNLPTHIWDNDSVRALTDWTLTSENQADSLNRKLNVSYHMWFHDRDQVEDGLDWRDTPQAKIAVWLHHEGGVHPEGNYLKGVQIAGLEWELWGRTGGDWDSFTFRRYEGAPPVKNVDLELRDFMHEVIWISGLMEETDRYLTGVELGCEVASARRSMFQVEPNFHINVESEGGSPPPQQRDTMYVEGRHLYTAAGDRVILRGVNAGIGWTDHPEREEHIRQIAASGANCLRIVWNPHRPNAVPGQNSRTPAQLDDVIGWTIENGMIPMVMLADAAGEPLRGSFNGELVKYWTQGEVPNILRKHERWLIINILNEGGRPDSSPQGPESDVDFVGFYAEEIGRLRSAGINVPLVIDAPNFGQNYQLIFNNWSILRDSDPQRSVMFSVHTYFGGTFQNRQNIYDTIFNRVVDENIPLLFGEGPTPTNTAPPGQGTCDASPWEHGLIGMHARDIGWLAWSWGVIRNGDCGQGGVNQFDLTKPGAQNGDWNTPYARQIMVDHNFSLRNTAVRPPGL